MIEALKSFLGTWKLQITGILIFLVLTVGYFGYRTINQKIGEYQNEIIPIEQTNIPGPSVFDDICMHLTNKPCP